MYRQINVNIIKEVLSFFEENSFGEDYHMSLEEDETGVSPSTNDSPSIDDRHGSADD